MTNPTAELDPLASYDSVPSISFDPSRGGHAMGEWVELVVDDYIKLVQEKDDSGALLFWEDSGKPKNKAVLSVFENGEKKSLWAKVNRKDGALFRVLVDAQKSLAEQTGDPARRLGPGDILRVRWARDNTAVPKKMGNHPKFYEGAARPGTAPAPAGADPLASTGSDPWASSAPASSPSGEPPF